MIRAPVISSRILLLTRSSFSCMTLKSGRTFLKTRITTRSWIGIETIITRAKRVFSESIITMPPMKNTGARTNMRSMDEMKSETAVTSLVRRVISEPIVNLSVCSKEKLMTFLYRSCRRSLANDWAALMENAPDRIPHRPPAATRRSILTPVVMIRAMSPPRTPLSMMEAIRRGWNRSMMTSPIMVRGARIASHQ